MPRSLATTQIPAAEILAVGSELLTPFRLDTNSLYLTAELNRLGIAVRRKTIAGDELENLTEALRSACSRSPLVIVCGGLGPTADDRTREAAAAALGLRLRRQPELESQLRAWFARRDAPMPEANLRQAELLAGAAALPNRRGTAPGQWLERDGCILVLLPGVPAELEAMFADAVRPRLVPYAGVAWRHEVLLLADLPESQADALAAPLYTAEPEVETTILAARPGEIELHLRARGAAAAPGGALERLQDRLAAALGERLAAGQASLEAAVIQLLRRHGETLAVAESCTGGLLSARLTSVPGASQVFLGGAVAYSNLAKRSLLQVSAASLETHGAVSAAVALELAHGARRRFGADWSLAITGIAGPEGGTPEKPVGLVFLACAAPQGEPQVVERRFQGGRERVRAYAAAVALNLLRLRLARGERARQEAAPAARVEL